MRDRAGTYVATMAEVAVDKATGAVKVSRVVCAQDMGVLVNPEGAHQQMEGCITMGLDYALAEEVRFMQGEVLDRNFDTYELPRFSWLPAMETIILDSPGLPAALDGLRQQFEFVLLDLPPVNVYGDALILGQRLDAAVIVLKCPR